MSGYQDSLHINMGSDEGDLSYLLDDFSYIDEKHGVISVPEGFSTDFASVKPLRSIALAILCLGLVLGFFLLRQALR
jgi:hypothetical protein